MCDLTISNGTHYDTPFGAISEAKQAALTGQTCKGVYENYV
jgi:hypothetical protein